MRRSIRACSGHDTVGQVHDSLQQVLQARGIIRFLMGSFVMVTTLRSSLLRVLLLAAGACTAVTAHAGVSVQVGGPFFSVGYRSGHHGHGHRHTRGGWGWGIGPVLVSPWVYPQVVTVVQPAPIVVEGPPAAPAQPARPDPVIYPRNGQSAQQLEADRQECNRWATTQPAALADSSVFLRAVDACMDGRGYTTK
jgi:hypothetical protein